MSVDLSAEILNELADQRVMLAEILERIANPPEAREWYSVDEVAAMFGKSSYTVREWCRHGQINAVKRTERRGGAALWSISAQEVSRYRNDGLLPSDPARNGIE